MDFKKILIERISNTPTMDREKLVLEIEMLEDDECNQIVEDLIKRGFDINAPTFFISSLLVVEQDKELLQDEKETIYMLRSKGLHSSKLIRYECKINTNL